jgi:hypothetical protein
MLLSQLNMNPYEPMDLSQDHEMNKIIIQPNFKSNFMCWA